VIFATKSPRHQGFFYNNPLGVPWCLCALVAIFLSVLLCLSAAGCGVKTEYLPQVSYPYVAEMDFLKEVKNVDGKAKKKRFKDDRVTAPFYFLLKVKEIENSGTIAVRFYETVETGQVSDAAKPEGVMGRQVQERVFQFGQPGKYYEYIIFFDRVEGFSPGKYRYGVFYNDKLIYENYLDVNPSKEIFQFHTPLPVYRPNACYSFDK